MLPISNLKPRTALKRRKKATVSITPKKSVTRPLTAEAFAAYGPKAQLAWLQNSAPEASDKKVATRSMSAVVEPMESQRSVPSYLENYAKHGRVFAGRKEAKGLLRELEAIHGSQKIEHAATCNATEASEIYSNLISAYMVVWNDLILQLRSHNEDHAIVCKGLKAFCFELLDQIPSLSERYEKVQAELRRKLEEEEKKYETIFERNDRTELRLKHATAKIGEMDAEIHRLNLILSERKDEIDELIYKLDESKAQCDDSTFKISRLEESRASLAAQIEQREAIIESQQEQIENRIQEIARYQEEAIFLRRDLEKTAGDLRAQLEMQGKEIDRLKARPNFVNVEVQTDPVEFSKHRTSGRTVNIAGGGTPSPHTPSPAPTTANVMPSRSEWFGSKKRTTSVIDQVSILSKKKGGQGKLGHANGMFRDSDEPAFDRAGTLEDLMALSDTEDGPKVSQKHTKSFRKSEAGAPRHFNAGAVADHVMRMAPMTSSGSSSLGSASELEVLLRSSGSIEGYGLDMGDRKMCAIQELPTAEESVRRLSDFRSESERRFTPEKCRLNMELLNVQDSQTLGSYVDRLFPMACSEPTGAGMAPFSFVITREKEYETKSLTWTLRQIVYILRNGFEVDCLAEPRIEFLEVITRILARSGKNQQIVERIRGNMFHSLLQHRENSNTVQFFMMFMSGDYTIADFRFFNMFFSFAFNCLYPSVDQALENPDLKDDFDLFFIHRGYAEPIAQTFLRTSFPAATLHNMHKHPDYTELVPFWALSREMISLFQEVHRRFHRQVHNILRLVGCADAESSISKEVFFEFIRVVDPCAVAVQIKELWSKMQLLCAMNEGQTVLAYDMYIKFCGQDPILPRLIVEMPYHPHFVTASSSLAEPGVVLLHFLRKRFTEFLPQYMEGLPEETRHYLQNYVKKMRNAFLKCDASTVLMAYRYILQYVDLKGSEEMPYEIITPTVTSEDVSRMINHLMMRECLATLSVKVSLNVDQRELIRKEHALNGTGGENPGTVQLARKSVTIVNAARSGDATSDS
jgi:hypothetical protein